MWMGKAYFNSMLLPTKLVRGGGGRPLRGTHLLWYWM